MVMQPPPSSQSGDPSAQSELESSQSPVATATTLWNRISHRPFVAHIIRAVERFSDRLGNHFAAALTYLSLLAVVPILMVLFSAAGFVLANRPDLMQEIEDSITEHLPASLATMVTGIIDSAIDARLTVGIIGLVIALYSGVSWVGSVREAVRAQWRPEFEQPESTKDNIVIATLKDLATLAGFGLALLVSVGLTTVASSAQQLIIGWLDLEGVGWMQPVLTVVTLLVAVASDFVIFFWLYLRLPEKQYPAPRRALVLGCLTAAAGFEILKILLTFLLPKVTNSTAGAIFGPIIGLLFFFNLVARLVLLVAAWIATAPGGPGEPAEKLPEIPGPTASVRREVGAGEAIGLVGVGAALGWAAGRRRKH